MGWKSGTFYKETYCVKKVLLFFYFIVFCLEIFPQAFYTIIDDDAVSNKAIENIKKLADRKNIKITFAPVALNLIRNQDICDSLLSYQKQGFHICNHSYSHSFKVWKEIDLSNIQHELKQSSEALDSLGFKNHNYFVYPFGKFRDNVRDSIIYWTSKQFKLAFNSRGRYNTFATKDFNKYYIQRFPFRSHNDWMAVKKIIDQATEKKAWIVFLTHSNSSDFSIKGLEQVIDYCHQKGLKSYTVHEAYQQIICHEQSYNSSSDFSLYDEIIDVLYMHRFSGIFIIAFLFVTIYIGIIIVRKF